jgi:hypothetical protein
MMNHGPLHPNIPVRLVGEDGNAYASWGGATEPCSMHADLPQAEIEAFLQEAKAGDYDALLRTGIWWLSIT